MRISTLIYSVRQGLKNISRNKLFSLASIGTIAACIFLLGLFYAIVMNFQNFVQEAEEQIVITVFFKNEIEQEAIDNIGTEIKALDDVDYIEYTSAEEAWDKYSADYFADYPELADGYKKDNPLANSASYTVYLTDLSKQGEIVEDIEAMSDIGVRKVKYSESTADTLSDFGKLAGYISVAVIAVLLAVGIFLISNTIMIGISVRKEEIGIMKLIGATDFFVRAPFVIEGVLIGIIGASIPLAAIYLIYENIIVYVMRQFSGLSNYMNFIGTNEIFRVLLPMGLLIGAGIGFIGSRISIRKHLII